MNQNSFKDFSISANSQNELSISYYGQITSEILEFKFLQEDQLNQILSDQELHEFSSIIVIIDQDEKQQGNFLFDISNGINEILKIKILKGIKEISFNFPFQDQLIQKIKAKKIKYEKYSEYTIEIFDQNDFEIKIGYREELKEQDDWSFLLNSKSFVYLLQNFGKTNFIQENLESFQCVLNDQFEYILLKINNGLKLEILDKFDSDIQEKYRYFSLLLSDNNNYQQIKDLDVLSNLLVNPIKNHEKLCHVSYTLMYDQAPTINASLFKQMNVQILSSITLFSKLVDCLSFYITPIEVFFYFTFREKKIHFLFLQPYYYPINYLIILFQHISQFQLFQKLDVDFSSNNPKYINMQIFTFIIQTQRVLQNVELGISFSDQELIPRGSVISFGDGLIMISDYQATYQLHLVEFLEIYSEIVSFISYLKQYSPNITQIKIYCSLLSFDEFKYRYYIELLEIVESFHSLIDFKIINNSQTEPRFWVNIYEDTFEKEADQYFIQKRKILFTYLKIQETLGKRIKKEIIKELIEYLPKEYHCLKRFQF